MAYFATEYTIHFDDTMAYGSHHFLTSFKFQCAARESFLFGERIFDIAGVKEALESVHLLTADAYSRNLNPAKLGDRLAILLSLEEWGRASARFCYRVISEHGKSICAGFQTLICADASTQVPMPLPPQLQQAMNAMRAIEETRNAVSFRDRVLAGGRQVDSLFGEPEREAARQFLSQRYPSPSVVSTSLLAELDTPSKLGHPCSEPLFDGVDVEAWVFAGQAAFDAKLLSERVQGYRNLGLAASEELEKCAVLVTELIGGDARALVSGSMEACDAAVRATPSLSQVAIHFQNVLGAEILREAGHQPSILMGHSFGEIAALGVAGCFDLQTGIRIVCMRVRAIAVHAPPSGGLMVISSNRCVANTEAQILGLSEVIVAGRNHELQTVMSGPLDQLQRFKTHLNRIGISATTIPSPTSFHHPRLRSAASHWLQDLRRLEFKAPSERVYSPIGRRFIAPGDDIAQVLAGQFLRPFDFQGAIDDALEAGVTKFVDCGSSGMLARLITKAGGEQLNVCGVELNSSHSVPSATLQVPSATLRFSDATSEHVEESPNLSREDHVDSNELSQDQEATSDTRIVPPIAIVGQGCILPGGAFSPAQLFAAITEERVGLVDQRNFDPHWSADFYSEKLAPDRSNSHLTGRVNDADISVPTGIDPTVFANFTRTQKLLCIALAPCIAPLQGADRVLCLIGATADGFEDQDEVSSMRFAGIDPRTFDVNKKIQSEPFQLHDPHSAVQEVFDRLIRPGLQITLVDAACASSLYTIALGMRALETNQADAVVAGGFFCPGPGNSCLFSQFRGTTSTGCRPFDAQADGVVFSEGAALVTLRRLKDAEQMGLPIAATVIGAGLSSDGKSSSANVPQTKGQLLSLARCYDDYNIDPASIDAIEGHGTSTPVGDSTELDTLRQFFAGRNSKPIPLHSLKGLLGHAGWAAGTASVIAACEYMRHGMFPAQANHHEPSAALKRAAGTLSVATTPVFLPRQHCRIAIDGFGFGGANAHLVLENYVADTVTKLPTATTYKGQGEIADELVFVAYFQEPTTSSGFDRKSVKLSKKHIVLPELADDMDISQTLAVVVTEQLLSQLPQFDEALRRETSVVLAMSGKTERGVEATMRIMTPRFMRVLDGDDVSLKLIKSAYNRARPSGAYTLQCMMPNVAAGRAALLHNLNGPNFVVDAGPNSLEAALLSAQLLLLGGEKAGVKLAIVAAIDANSASIADGISSKEKYEYAAAFGVATRRHAEQQGLKIISGVNEALRAANIGPEFHNLELASHQKVQALLEALGAERNLNREAEIATALPVPTRLANTDSKDSILVSANSTHAPTSLIASSAASASGTPLALQSITKCKIHAPTWIEKRVYDAPVSIGSQRVKSLLVLVHANAAKLEELIAALPDFAEQFMVAIVGELVEEVATPKVTGRNVIYVDLKSSQEISAAIRRIQEFRAEMVISADTVTSWDRTEVLSKVATDNSLCEMQFLVAQCEASRLNQGSIELWGLFIDAWNGEVHPKSGSVAGLLKSINREFPSAKTGVICTRGVNFATALQFVFAERWQKDREAEIICDGEFRLVRRLRPVTISLDRPPLVKLNSRSVVVATGGAKGVTAVMLDALLRDSHCTAIVLGRSPLEAGPADFDLPVVERNYYRALMVDSPKATLREMKSSFEAARARWEAHQTIKQLSSLGGRVEYLECDVTDRLRMEAVIEQIVSRYGRIDLLLHGAGVQKSKRLAERSLADFRQTYGVKVAGLQNLVECSYASLGRSVNAHVLTSAYSVFGNDGQHDYGAANETLDRLCCLVDTDPAIKWSSLAWLAWDGTGMTRGSEYRALAKKRRLSKINAELGQQIFREVLAGQTGSSINVPMSEAEHVEYAVKTIPTAAPIKKGRTLEFDIKLSSIACLPFHKVRETPTLPGAWVLDLFVNAGLRFVSNAERLRNLTVQNMSFSRFVRFANNQETNVRVVAQEDDNAIDVWLISDILHPSGLVLSKDVVCASARLFFGVSEVTASFASHCSESGLYATHAVTDPYCTGNKKIDLSGLFNCLSDIRIGADSRQARFNSTQYPNSSSHIPALLLDAAWRLGAMYADAGKGDVFVPLTIGKIILPLGPNASPNSNSKWEIRSTTPKLENRNVRWDRTEAFDQSGRLKLVVENAMATQLL